MSLNLTSVELDLSGNNFSNSNISAEFSRFSSLTHLDLSNCYFKGQIPSEIFRLSKLQSLYFLGDKIKFGPHDFELVLQNLTQLRELDLTYINISSTKWNSSASLKVLDLNEVNLCGNFLPESLGYITSLQYLALAYCSLKGPIPESLSNLTSLEYLTLDGTIPSGIFSFPSLMDLLLSNNHFYGQLEDFKIGVSKIRKAASGVGSFNMLTSVGSIPLQSVEIIDLRSNLLHGSLPIPPKSMRYFFILENNLSEEIPSSICNLTSLVMLDLARNNLRGEITQCLGKITALEVLDMRRNNLSGNLPTTFISGSSLRSLNLHGDKLEGRIPQSLTNCNELQVLDLGDNHLIGIFPIFQVSWGISLHFIY
ncbi:hypothetical protein P3S68_032089 [Capsicum galapagoense]